MKEAVFHEGGREVGPHLRVSSIKTAERELFRSEDHVTRFLLWWHLPSVMWIFVTLCMEQAHGCS